MIQPYFPDDAILALKDETSVPYWSWEKIPSYEIPLTVVGQGSMLYAMLFVRGSALWLNTLPRPLGQMTRFFGGDVREVVVEA